METKNRIRLKTIEIDKDNKLYIIGFKRTVRRRFGH